MTNHLFLVFLITIALVADHCEYASEGVCSNDGFNGLSLRDGKFCDQLQFEVCFVQYARGGRLIVGRIKQILVHHTFVGLIYFTTNVIAKGGKIFREGCILGDSPDISPYSDFDDIRLEGVVADLCCDEAGSQQTD